MAIINQGKKIMNYHNTVPQDIIDLMGDEKYLYINGYNGYAWKNTHFSTYKPELRDTQSQFYDFPSDFDKLYELLTTIKNNPNFISSSKIDYEDEGFYVTLKYTPTRQEEAEYDEKINQYNYEEEKFKKLQTIIKNWTTNSENLDYKKQYFELKKELDTLKKALAKLK